MVVVILDQTSIQDRVVVLTSRGYRGVGIASSFRYKSAHATHPRAVVEILQLSDTLSDAVLGILLASREENL